MTPFSPGGPIPVDMLTGFPGSGKTNVLRRILAEEKPGDSAVLVNEFGEVGLDHILVGEIAPNVILLNNGGLCCTLRNELSDALIALLSSRVRGLIAPFKKVIVETTGFARPALILSKAFSDNQIRHHYFIGRVVAMVDAMHALTQIGEQDVWTEQVTAAHDLVITKTDMVDEYTHSAVLDMLDKANPTARRLYPGSRGVLGLFSEQILDEGEDKMRRERIFDLADLSPGEPDHLHSSMNVVRISIDEPINWESFVLWLSMFLHMHGSNIMRVKGLLWLEKRAGPVVIQCVRHVMHPPENLAAWGDIPKRTELMFIVRYIEPQLVQRSFESVVLQH